MATVSDILQEAAIYLGQSNVSALTINGYNAGLAAINRARQLAERAHDWKYSEANAYLTITTSGTDLAQAFSAPSGSTIGVVDGGGANPDPTGTYNYTGQINNLPFYSFVSGSDTFFLFYSVNSWFITQDTLDTTNSFSMLTGSTNPGGSYLANGAFSGVATVNSLGMAVKVKRVKYVALPIAAGNYEIIEFLTNDQFLSRVQMQTGRQVFMATKSLPDLGSYGMINPLAYQNANTIYLYAPSGLVLPITAQLNCVIWQNDYVNTTDADFFTTYGPEFLMWQTVLEINKKFRYLTVRQEGNLEEPAVQTMASAALQTLIEWDSGIDSGTSELPVNVPAEAPANG